MSRPSLLALLLGVIALVSGPLLLQLVPTLPAASATPWNLPGESHDIGGVPMDLRLDAPDKPAPIYQASMVTRDQHSVYFQRYSYAVARVDQDLVPWFPALYGKRWVKVAQRRDRGDPDLNVVMLQNSFGSAALVLVYALRVGPYVTPGFNVAKVLQIPAKLRGHNVFEIVAVSGRCTKDCEQVAAVSTSLLREAITRNVR